MEIIALDGDDDSDDGDVQIAAPSAPRRSAVASTAAVVDLTRGTASTGRPNNDLQNNSGRLASTNSEEVQFVGSTASSARLPSSNGAAAHAVQFLGTKRPRPSSSGPQNNRRGSNSRPQNGSGARAATHSMASLDPQFHRWEEQRSRTANRGGAGGIGGGFGEFGGNANSGGAGGIGRGFGGFGGFGRNPFGFGRGNNRHSLDNAMLAQLRATSDIHPSAAMLRGESTWSNDKRKKRTKANTKSAEPPAMEKGKALQRPQGFDALDVYYPRLKANDRTSVLHNLTAATGHAANKKSVHDWRVQYEKAHPKPTLWALARGWAERVNSLDEKRPAQKENKPAHNSASPETKGDTATDSSESKPTASIGPLSGPILDTLQTFFVAYLGKARHKAMLEAIQATDSQSGLACGICADDFDAGDTVACSGEDNVHFFCKPCLASYCTVTVQSGAVGSMACPMPDCKSLFPTNDIKSILSEWDVLMIERREDGRDRRVALAAKAMLHCECGMVAVVTEEDMGDGRVACPGEGCGRRYCAKCGNEDHGKESCPPPAETMQWLDENSKECPNCKQRVEKNGGCDHMTCAPPGGCGYEWWWSCGCPYRGAHKCGQQSGVRRPW